MVAHELAGERRRRVEREPHGGVRAFGDVARGVEAAHVGLHPAGADRIHRDRAGELRRQDRGDCVEQRLRHPVSGMAAVIVGERAHAARHVHDARRAAAFQKRDQLLRQMQRPERIGFERFPHRREIDLQRRRFALGDDARIVDQRVDVAVSVFQKIAEAFDALAIGHVERMKRRRVLASRELLDRRFAGGALARRQHDLHPARYELPADLETDAAIATGDDDNRIVVRARHRRLGFVQKLERVRPLVLGEAQDAPQHAQRLDRARRFHLAHVGCLPAELIVDAAHDGLGLVVIAADEHGRLGAARKMRIDHARVADGVVRLDEMRVGKRVLQSLHQRPIEVGVEFQHAVFRRRIRNRVGRVDHRLA